MPIPSMASQMLPLDNRPEDWVFHEDDAYFVKCKVAEDILDELVQDTVQECRRVFSLRRQQQQQQQTRERERERAR